MSSSFVAAPDSRSAVRSTRKVEEKRGDEEENEVEIFEDEEHHADLGLQTARPHTQKSPAAAKRCSKATTATLGLFFLLMLAGIYIRYVLVTLEKDQLQIRFDKLKENFSGEKDMAANNSQLLSSYNNLRENHKQLQDEVKKLKSKTEAKCRPDGWTRFGGSCYFKSNREKSWEESRDDCESKGAHLVIINSKEEQKFIRELSVDGQSWIGLRTIWTAQTYKWRWVDGSPLTFWARGQQMAAGYQKAALCCDQAGKWIQSYNYYQKKWICEKEVS